MNLYHLEFDWWRISYRDTSDGYPGGSANWTEHAEEFERENDEEAREYACRLINDFILTKKTQIECNKGVRRPILYRVVSLPKINGVPNVLEEQPHSSYAHYFVISK